MIGTILVQQVSKDMESDLRRHLGKDVSQLKIFSMGTSLLFFSMIFLQNQIVSIAQCLLRGVNRGGNMDGKTATVLP
jgi:hypothetical protein